MPEEIKEQIYEFLKANRGKRYNLKELTEELKICTHATIIKWTTVLVAEKDREFIVSMKDYGNVKIVWIQ